MKRRLPALTSGHLHHHHTDADTDTQATGCPVVAKILRTFRPTAFWHQSPATQAQLDLISQRKWRVPPYRRLTRGEAWAILNSPTIGQRAALTRLGHDPADFTFDEAWELLKIESRSPH